MLFNSKLLNYYCSFRLSIALFAHYIPHSVHLFLFF